MSLGYIRSQYEVPARRGQRVEWRGRPGTIVSSRNAYIRVRLDERPHGACVVLHPTDDDLIYLSTAPTGGAESKEG